MQGRGVGHVPPRGHPVVLMFVGETWLKDCGPAYRCVQQGSHSFEHGGLRNRSFNIGSCLGLGVGLELG